MKAPHRTIKLPTRKKGADKTARQRIWQSMRILRFFTQADLIATADTTKWCVNTMLRALKRTGVIRKTGNSYFLVKNMGPHAPSIMAGGSIYDHNSKKEIPLIEGERHDK